MGMCVDEFKKIGHKAYYKYRNSTIRNTFHERYTNYLIKKRNDKYF